MKLRSSGLCITKRLHLAQNCRRRGSSLRRRVSTEGNEGSEGHSSEVKHHKSVHWPLFPLLLLFKIHVSENLSRSAESDRRQINAGESARPPGVVAGFGEVIAVEIGADELGRRFGGGIAREEAKEAAVA